MAASDQTPIGSLTELTSLAAADRFVIEDDSANETKYITGANLASNGYAHIYRAVGGATAITGSGSAMTTVPMATVGTEAGAVGDLATDGITLPAGAAVYQISYHVGLYRTTGTGNVTATAQLAADAVLIPGSTSNVNSSGTADKHSQGAMVIFLAAGGEVITIEAQSTVELTVDPGTLVLHCITPA